MQPDVHSYQSICKSILIVVKGDFREARRLDRNLHIMAENSYNTNDSRDIDDASDGSFAWKP